MRKILCTVGTSLINNASRSHWKTSSASALSDFIKHKGEKTAGAETNSLSHILQEKDHILFLHSQTEEGYLCADALCRYYADRGFSVKSREIKGLTYTHNSFALHGLRSLISALTDEIRISRRMSIQPVINATGGFKAEIAYATLVGLIFQVPVYYIHELFQDIIEMPPLPVNWDPSLFIAHEDFFDWIAQEFRRKEKVLNRLKGRPHEINMFLHEDSEGYITLSPAGEVYYQAFCHLKEKAKKVMISEKALRYFKNLDSTRQEIFSRLIKKLNLEQVRSACARQEPTTDCFIYPTGNTKERIFYFTDENKVLHICELAQHGDNYEELHKRRVNKANYTRFIPFEFA
ncbi:putative CRISPR-associated protein [Thermosyntropha sp.]|uniref:putative CRISPR-associated protein n=1 Tax=Thermosyntropha sp. TaxID=2740820 RepID=UPI0025F7236C|nr:putative CRISPR-associated protein [Thermosyntropha sp.]MBO8159679.1 putative CRISPR-associated protein [Thermosyntropha sp.]